MTITLAMIVKNEERVLARCLNSAWAAVDEIVIVDTGSDDATEAVARRYTDRIYDYPWHDDFAAARQFAFAQVHSDWVMWLDADDVIVHADRIKPLLANVPSTVDGFYWRYVADCDVYGNPRCQFWRERCVRNNGTFRWEGRVHEVLVPQPGCSLVQSHEVFVEHHPDPTHRSAKLQRNLQILEQERLASGTAPSPRLLYYLGQEYASAGAYDKALESWRQYLDVSEWNDERYLATTRMADVYRAQRQYDLAINSDLAALKICPHWPDAYFGLAETYYYQQDWPKVVHWTEVGRAMPRPDTLCILNPLDYRYHWIIYYTNALYHLGSVREALDWTKHALEICPDDPYHRENFLLFARAISPTSSEQKKANDVIHSVTLSDSFVWTEGTNAAA